MNGRAPNGRLLETGVAAAVLLVVGVLAFGTHVRHGGFYYDDWANSAHTFYPQKSGLLGVTEFWRFDRARPGSAVWFPLVNRVFGYHMHWHLAFGLLLAVAMSAALFHLLRDLAIERVHAGAIAVLVLLFPASDSTRLWAVASLASLTILLYLLGVIVSLRAFERRSLKLHAAGVAFYGLSVLTYEIALAAIVVTAALYLLRAPPRQVLRRWAVDVGAMAVLVLLFTIHNKTHAHQSLGTDLHHVHLFWTFTPYVVASSAIPFGSPERWLVIGLGAAVLAAALVAQALVQGPERSFLRRWLAVALAGIAAIALGYLPFVPADVYYVPVQPGVGNRVNAFAALGYVLLAYAVGVLLVGMVLRLFRLPARTVAAATAVALLAFLGIGYVRELRHDNRNWNAAYGAEHAMLLQIRGLLPDPRPHTTVFTFGHPAFYAPGVPLFAENWDLNGALKIQYHDGTLSGQPVRQGAQLRCLANGVDVVPPGPEQGYGRVGAASYPNAVLIDIGARRLERPRNAAACRAVIGQFQPGVPQLKPD